MRPPPCPDRSLTVSSADLTVPGTATADPVQPNPSLEPEPLSFPLGWLLEHASAPIKYRALTEIAKSADVAAMDLSWLPYSHRPAIKLAVTQSRDGTWNQSILSLPSRHSADFAHIGTVPAVRRLVECGWSPESPPLVLARRLLFRLLAEDNDPAFLFELGTKVRDDDL